MSMVESLVALVVLCLGLLGLGQFMARQLVETRMANDRSIALQHIEAIRESLSLDLMAPQSVGPFAWKTLDALGQPRDAALPAALAAVFRSAEDPTQVGIAIAWPANERTMSAEDERFQRALLDASAADSGIDCPPTHLCHLVYVHP